MTEETNQTTTIKSDPNFTSPKYDYINHKWVDTSADALLHEGKV